MVAFLLRRLALGFVTIWLISILSFAIIQLPPGDFVSAYIAQLAASGSSVSADPSESLLPWSTAIAPPRQSYARAQTAEISARPTPASGYPARCRPGTRR